LITPIVLLVTGIGFFAFIIFREQLAPYMMGLSPVVLAVLFGQAQNIMSKSTKYSLFDPTKEMAYVPLDQESKVKGKAAIDVVGARLGKSGGALINQAIHQVDLLLYLIGDVHEVSAYWQLGGLHQIESEDSVCALLRYGSGATGVIQASTALWPGFPERLEITGTKGTAIITGDKLTAWEVQEDEGETAPVSSQGASGASDPMAISVLPFERQILDFGEACRMGRPPSCSGRDGLRALKLVQSIYESCREGHPINIEA